MFETNTIPRSIRGDPSVSNFAFGVLPNAATTSTFVGWDACRLCVYIIQGLELSGRGRLARTTPAAVVDGLG